MDNNCCRLFRKISSNFSFHFSIQTFQSQTFENSQQYNAGGSTVASQGFNNSQNYGAQPTNSYVNNKYPGSNNYGTTPESAPSQPLRPKTRVARVPPPSKVVNCVMLFPLF